MSVSLVNLRKQLPSKYLLHGLAWLVYLGLAMPVILYTISPKGMYSWDESSFPYAIMMFFSMMKELALISMLGVFLPLFPLLLVGSGHEDFKKRHSLPLFAANTIFFALPLFLFVQMPLSNFFGAIIESNITKELKFFIFALIFLAKLFLIYRVKHAFSVWGLSLTIACTVFYFLISLASLLNLRIMTKIIEGMN